MPKEPMQDLSQPSISTQEVQLVIGQLVLENMALKKQNNELLKLVAQSSPVSVAEKIIQEAAQANG